MANVQIIIGSVMGQAEAVARAVAAQLSEDGHTATLNPFFEKGDLDENSVILICTSNTGMGDLPNNILPLYAYLKHDCPNLVARLYGIINLGDSSYPNFAQAGQTLDEALADLGAKRVGDPLVMDAIYVDDYEQEAKTWAHTWGQQL